MTAEIELDCKKRKTPRDQDTVTIRCGDHVQVTGAHQYETWGLSEGVAPGEPMLLSLEGAARSEEAEA